MNLQLQHPTTLDRILAPVHAFLHKHGWTITILWIAYYYAKKTISPYYDDYRRKKTIEKCNDPVRVNALNEQLGAIRENQQVDHIVKAKVAALEAREKKIEQLKRKQVKDPRFYKNGKDGHKLGASKKKTLSEVFEDVEGDRKEVKNDEQMEDEKIKQIAESPKNDQLNTVLQQIQTESVADSESWRKVRAQQDKEYLESEAKDRAKEEERQKVVLAREKLEPEPNHSNVDCVHIAFRLPRRCSSSRIERRFNKYSLGEQLRYFVTTRTEMSRLKNWSLTLGFVSNGNDKFDERKTLAELGLSPRGLIVVIDEDV
mmetsp:Transcript_19528/g.25290  ORF Transcript_19528/g.25290 Transcript_19528/m.25290 type:complete len:315 (-) Transcript_19528:23-967(-)